MGRQKSIVLVTVDCLRADHVGFMGYDRPTTPFLDSLAGESFVIPGAIVAGAPTYYSLPAILASRYPLALGRDVLGLGPDEPTLTSVLKQAGYATAAFGAGNPYLSARFGYQQGFDTFRDFLPEANENKPKSLVNEKPIEEKPNPAADSGAASRLNRMLQKARSRLGPLGAVYDELYFEYCQRATPPAESLNALRRFPAADVLVDDACEWLSSIGDAPCFLWLHLMDPHSPYYPKEEALKLMGSQSIAPNRARYLNSYWNRSDLRPRRFRQHRDEIIALYDAGIRWVDEQVARLLASLRCSNRWEDCIFALTADHGEEFLDHSGRYHPPSNLMEELIHVPLLLRAPGSAKQAVSNSPFSLLHLAPTVLDAAQLPAPPSFQGRSHWEPLRRGESFDGVAISECVAGCTNPFRRENRMGPRVLSVRESRFKLVLHFGSIKCNAAGEFLYDLEADPDEQAPLSPATQKTVRRRLLETAREHLRKSSEERSCKTRIAARLRDVRLEWERSSLHLPETHSLDLKPNG